MSDLGPSSIDLYLDLMIKCLTNTIYGDRNTGFWTTKDYDEHRRRRGEDWPVVAHSMIGVYRREHLRQLTERVIAEQVPGDLIETGVWRGGACIMMRAVLKAHNETTRRVFVADSFQGLPPPDVAAFPADAGQDNSVFGPLMVSAAQVAENFRAYGLLDEQVVFVEGWFRDTLPGLDSQRLALIRLDGDMYESTIQALDALYPKLSVGGFVIIDDYGSWPACKQAVHDFRDANAITDEIIRIDDNGVWWQRTG